MKKLTLPLVLASALLAAAPSLALAQATEAGAARMQGTPSELVLENTQRVLSTLEQRRAEFTSDRAALEAFVKSEFDTMFDREYAARLPMLEGAPVVTLQEGGTPLIPAEHLSELTGADVFVKYEGLNPTASFKDRGMTAAISVAARNGAQAVICASTGNTSASAAAYATMRQRR